MTVLIIVLLILLFLCVVAFLAGTVFFKFSLDTKSRFYLPRKEKQREKTPEELANLKKRQEMDEYVHQNSEKHFITSFDGLKLCGYLMRAEKESHKYAILCHGYEGSPAEMLRFGLYYKELGFNSLFIDQRCFGQSEGRYCTMGVKESRDVKAWMEYILSFDSSAQFCLHGISMGSATVMNVLSLDIPTSIKFVVEDCGFTSIWEIFSYQLKTLFHLPVFPIMYLASFAARVFAHISYHQGNCKKSLSNSNIPIMFAHGKADEVVPFFMEKQLYDSAKAPKKIIEVEGAKHTKACSTDEKAYYKLLDELIAESGIN